MTVIFLMLKRRVYKCALKAETTKNQEKRYFFPKHGQEKSIPFFICGRMTPHPTMA